MLFFRLSEPDFIRFGFLNYLSGTLRTFLQHAEWQQTALFRVDFFNGAGHPCTHVSRLRLVLAFEG